MTLVVVVLQSLYYPLWECTIFKAWTHVGRQARTQLKVNTIPSGKKVVWGGVSHMAWGSLTQFSLAFSSLRHYENNINPKQGNPRWKGKEKKSWERPFSILKLDSENKMGMRETISNSNLFPPTHFNLCNAKNSFKIFQKKLRTEYFHWYERSTIYR